ncbi:hypothetical protein F5X96DRAFT_396962 [Biscogniauxia mediterranea]|nr:hypothetical protein F5X96DRAFT_396962 [Biscogniauxia mediterranea]
MSQEERNLPSRDHPSSSSEDGERSSQQATGVPTEPASLVDSPPSQLSRQGPRRPVTRQLAQGIQAYQRSHLGVMSSREEILKWDDGQINMFQGLTPPPLPMDMLPKRKRTIREILFDENRPRKDKLAEEIDKLANEAGPSSSYILGHGPADLGAGGEASGANAPKRIRLHPIPRVMPTDEPAGSAGSGHDTGGDEDSPEEGSSSRQTRDSDGNDGSFSVSR